MVAKIDINALKNTWAQDKNTWRLESAISKEQPVTAQNLLVLIKKESEYMHIIW